MMSIAKRIMMVLLVLFIAMQFIRPARNQGTEEKGDIITLYDAPEAVARILRTSCYDCHSNHTRYPWYTNIQPIGWLLSDHIKDGKEQLNLSEFGTYSKRRQLSKLKAVENSIKDGSMPLSQYVLLHGDAKLSEESEASILIWTTGVMDSLSGE